MQESAHLTHGGKVARKLKGKMEGEQQKIMEEKNFRKSMEIIEVTGI